MSALKSVPRTTPRRNPYGDAGILADGLSRMVNSYQLAHPDDVVKIGIEFKTITRRGPEAFKITIEPLPPLQDPLPGMGVDAIPDWDDVVQDYERRQRDEE